MCERNTPPLFVPDLDSPQVVDVYGATRLFNGSTVRTQNVVTNSAIQCGAGANAPDAVFSFTLTSRTRLTVDMAGSESGTRVGLFRGTIDAAGYTAAGSRCVSTTASGGAIKWSMAARRMPNEARPGQSLSSRAQRGISFGKADGALFAVASSLRPEFVI